MKQNNISVQSVNTLVLYKDSFDLEVQTFRMNLLQFTETKKDQVQNITADIVNSLMRSLAVETYKLTKKEDIQLFSCHSLRVGACTLLFSTNYPSHFIKKVLRWRSDSWQTYVRDLIVTSIQHNEALLKADTMPSL